jgi:S-disulfanyl-L-cysteine oxidoreductase SoxD
MVLKATIFGLTIILSFSAVAADGPHLGEPANPARLATWDIDISPDGAGLPAGLGSADEGDRVYAAKCAMCHGPNGRGGPANRLTGGLRTLRSPHPVNTVASYWLYATTLFGFIRAAIPITSPWCLSVSEVYGLCAYLLLIDGIVPREIALDRKNLTGIVMPNRNGFRSMWRRGNTRPLDNRLAPQLAITARTRVLGRGLGQGGIVQDRRGRIADFSHQPPNLAGFLVVAIRTAPIEFHTGTR